MANKYPASTLIEISAIPDEALPRFYAELPAMIAEIKKVMAAKENMATNIKAAAPWWLRWLPDSFWLESLKQQVATRIHWIDDDKGVVTVSAGFSENTKPFYSRTEKLS